MSGRGAPSLGALRERVELKQTTQSIDSAGGHVDVFVSLGLVWAEINTASGSLTVIGDARNSKITHSIIIRFRNDLKPGDRVIYRGHELEVISAEDLNGRTAYLKVLCSQLNIAG